MNELTETACVDAVKTAMDSGVSLQSLLDEILRQWEEELRERLRGVERCQVKIEIRGAST